MISRLLAGLACCMNIGGMKYIFGGAPAHQLAAWNGRNALQAVIHPFVNIDSVRSNLRPEARIQGVITEGGATPVVVSVAVLYTSTSIDTLQHRFFLNLPVPDFQYPSVA